jgi:hypothetical protein
MENPHMFMTPQNEIVFFQSFDTHFGGVGVLREGKNGKWQELL